MDESVVERNVPLSDLLPADAAALDGVAVAAAGRPVLHLELVTEPLLAEPAEPGCVQLSFKILIL